MRSRERDERGARASRVTLCDRVRDVRPTTPISVLGRSRRYQPKVTAVSAARPATDSNRDLRTGGIIYTRPSSARADARDTHTASARRPRPGPIRGAVQFASRSPSRVRVTLGRAQVALATSGPSSGLRRARGPQRSARGWRDRAALARARGAQRGLLRRSAVDVAGERHARPRGPTSRRAFRGARPRVPRAVRSSWLGGRRRSPVRGPRSRSAGRSRSVRGVLCSSMQPCEREKSLMGAILSERRTDASAPARSLG